MISNMSFTLWKYTCKPNNPVCEAYVIFVTPANQATNVEEALLLGQLLAEDVGCNYATVSPTLVRLGIFVPLMPDVSLTNPVVSYATGEY